MNYWLFKSEPTTYGIDHLKKDGVTAWSGVRNYQARNFMRDDAKIGDLVLYYHSNTKIPGIVGLAKVISEPKPDLTQFDPTSDYFDPMATKANLRWQCVDLEYVETFKKIYSLEEIKENNKLKNLRILQKGNRLSITPVSKDEFCAIIKASREASS